MTTKQISEAIGKDERTIRRWVKRLADKSSVVADKMAASSPIHPADYDLEESVQIIEIGMGRNAADLFRMSAREKAPDTIAEVVKTTVLAMIPAMAEAMRIAMGGKPTEAPSLPAPPLALRDEFRMIVAKAAKASGDYAATYGLVYQEILYRLHINVKERAKNAGVQAIDILESEGLMGEAVLIARELFGRAA